MARTQMTPLRLRIASPCTERWEDMKGDERVRHCASCKLNVYSLHEMTMSEVEELMRSPSGRLCARLYQRKDGTVLTADCPVGLRKVRMRLVASMVASVAFLAAIVATVVQAGSGGGLSGLLGHQARIKQDLEQSPQVQSLYDRQMRTGMIATDNAY